MALQTTPGPVIQIGNGGTANFGAAVDSGETIAFEGNGTLTLGDAKDFAATLYDFHAGDVIKLSGSAANPEFVTNSSGSYLTVSLTSSGTTNTQGGVSPTSTIIIPVADTDTTQQLAVVSDGSGDTIIEVPCFLKNTMILTDKGERPVQDLREGDLVATTDGKLVPIVWMGTGQVHAERGKRNASTPIFIAKGALGDNMPHTDLRVTRGHSLYIEGKLIPAEFLVNHDTIRWHDEAQKGEKIYHIGLAKHDVVIANGVPAESLRDDKNLLLFSNSTAVALPKESYAEVLTGGPIVDAAWRRFAERAGPRRDRPVTKEADLHIETADGTRINPETITEGGMRIAFRLTGRQLEGSRLVSRSGAPDQLRIARDSRELGAGVRRFRATQHQVGQRALENTISAENPKLSDGYHLYEEKDKMRWTNGDAAIPAALSEGFDKNRVATLVVELAMTGTYPEDGRPSQSSRRVGRPGMLKVA